MRPRPLAASGARAMRLLASLVVALVLSVVVPSSALAASGAWGGASARAHVELVANRRDDATCGDDVGPPRSSLQVFSPRVPRAPTVSPRDLAPAPPALPRRRTGALRRARAPLFVLDRALLR